VADAVLIEADEGERFRQQTARAASQRRDGIVHPLDKAVVRAQIKRAGRDNALARRMLRLYLAHGTRRVGGQRHGRLVAVERERLRDKLIQIERAAVSRRKLDDAGLCKFLKFSCDALQNIALGGEDQGAVVYGVKERTVAGGQQQAVQVGGQQRDRVRAPQAAEGFDQGVDRRQAPGAVHLEQAEDNFGIDFI